MGVSWGCHEDVMGVVEMSWWCHDGVMGMSSFFTCAKFAIV